MKRARPRDVTGVKIHGKARRTIRWQLGITFLFLFLDDQEVPRGNHLLRALFGSCTL